MPEVRPQKRNLNGATSGSDGELLFKIETKAAETALETMPDL